MTGAPTFRVFAFAGGESLTILVAVLICICLGAARIPAKGGLACRLISIGDRPNLRVAKALKRFIAHAKTVNGHAAQKGLLATPVSAAIATAAQAPARSGWQMTAKKTKTQTTLVMTKNRKEETDNARCMDCRSPGGLDKTHGPPRYTLKNPQIFTSMPDSTLLIQVLQYSIAH